MSRKSNEVVQLLIHRILGIEPTRLSHLLNEDECDHPAFVLQAQNYGLTAVPQEIAADVREQLGEWGVRYAHIVVSLHHEICTNLWLLLNPQVRITAPRSILCSTFRHNAQVAMNEDAGAEKDLEVGLLRSYVWNSFGRVPPMTHSEGAFNYTRDCMNMLALLMLEYAIAGKVNMELWHVVQSACASIGCPVFGAPLAVNAMLHYVSDVRNSCIAHETALLNFTMLRQSDGQQVGTN